jgi:hypothetical protein
LQVVLLQVNKFRVDAGFDVLIPTLQGDIARLPGRQTTGSAPRLTLNEIIDAFPEGDERGAVATILREAANAGTTFSSGPSGTSIRVKCARWKSPVTIGWVFTPGKPAWMKTQQISFGHGLDYPETDPELLSVLETYYQEWVNDPLTGDASGKGVHARWLSPSTAATELPVIIERLQRVIKAITGLRQE